MSAMFDKESESGVSPVIGVILMVAVTVALVALVTVVVFDLGGDVSDSPDATVQLEETSGGVTATVLRNENVQDFTLQAETQSSGTSTYSLGGDAGAVQTANPATTTQVTGETVSGPIDDGNTVTLANGDLTSIDEVLTDGGDDGNFDTDVTDDFSISDAGAGDITYTASTEGQLTGSGDAIQVKYTHETGSATLTKVSVIANMADGSSEVLTSTDVNN